MKHRFVRTAVAAALSAALAAPAFADASIYAKLRAAGVQTHSLSVSIDDGVATIAGNVNDNLSRFRAERVLRATPGIDRVINLIAYD